MNDRDRRQPAMAAARPDARTATALGHPDGVGATYGITLRPISSCLLRQI